MLISERLNAAINDEIGRELEASSQYIAIAAYFDDRALRLLAKLFYKQSSEEREHAMKFVHYLADVGGKVAVPAIPAPAADFQGPESAIQKALDWELMVTRHINELMALAHELNDYAAQDFLKWFVTEQVEEVKTMDDLLKVAKQVGERNIIMVEAYLAHAE